MEIGIGVDQRVIAHFHLILQKELLRSRFVIGGVVIRVIVEVASNLDRQHLCGLECEIDVGE